MNWLTSSGIIRYDPPRGDMKTRTQWWCVIEADDEIARYYRWWVDRHVLNPLGFDKLGLHKPAWGAHISIVRGEQPRPEDMHHWKEHDGREIEFEYSPDVVQTGQNPDKPRPDHFWFLPIRCPLAVQIRDDFGLYTSYTLHMTIGRTY
jgi:hypothetical protein